MAQTVNEQAKLRLRRLLEGDEPGVPLSPAFRRILRVLREDLEEAVFLSGQELARRCGTNPSTVVRFSQKLGFSGYPAMAEALRQQLMQRLTPAARLMHLRAIPEASGVRSLIELERAALLEMEQRLEPELLDRVAEAILQAQRIFVFGEGPSVPVAELLAFRLRRFGMSPVLLTQTGKGLFDHLAGVGSRDVVVAFGFGRPPEELEACLRHARQVGAGTVLVCDHDLPYFAGLSDLRVQLVRRSLAEHRTMTVATAFVEILALRVTERDPERALRALDTLDRLRSRYGYPRLPSLPLEGGGRTPA